MNKDLHTLKGELENLEYQKKKHLKLSDELVSKTNQQAKAKKLLDKENRDVEKITSLSFASFMATLQNNLSEKIEKEELEALEAKHRYDAITYEIQALNEELEAIDHLLATEENIKNAYKEAYDKKKKELSAQSVALWEKIRLLEVDFDEKSAELKEIEEAKSACTLTLGSIRIASKELSSAEAMGVWDMLGGDLIATMAKRNYMNKAQNAINDVNYKLKRLKKELSDINEDVHLEIKIDDYLSFADYFFDGIFVDMFVQNKIHESQGKVTNLQNDIEHLNRHLKNLSSQVEAEKIRLKNEMDQVILAHA